MARHHVGRAGVTILLWLVVGVRATGGSAWRDPSPHAGRFVDVGSGVRLELLDWGGSGDTVLLLAGHGNTAHVFDDFAPTLTDAFRVVAMTRRGFGASSQPPNGYDLTTLVNDIAHVVETLKVRRVHLVGHSIAGDEMTRFAARHPFRVGALVYLDAAYDRVEARRVEATFPRLPAPPAPAPSDLASAAAMREYVARTDILLPEAEIRATRIFDGDGKFLRPVTPDWIVRAVAQTVEHPDYKLVRAPVLAIYAIPATPAQLLPRYSGSDPDTQRSLASIYDIWFRAAKTQRHRFRQYGAHVVEIAGGSHYIFLSHRDRTSHEVQRFLRPDEVSTPPYRSALRFGGLS